MVDQPGEHRRIIPSGEVADPIVSPRRTYGMHAKLAAVVSRSCCAGAAAPPAAAEVPLIRLIDGRESDRIVRVNPRTLEPVSRAIETFRRGWSHRLLA